MLTRQDNVSPSQKYYSDSLLTLPSTAQSVFDNFAAGVVSPVVGLNDLDSTFAQRPEGKAIHDTLNAVEMESQTPGMGLFQKSADWVANMVGYGINPISWGFGEIGSLAARGLGIAADAVAPDAVSVFMKKPLNTVLPEPLAKWVPSELGKEGEQKTLSAGLLSQNTIDNFGTLAGASVPGAIDANFNQDNGNISWGGVARDAGEMGAFGIAIGSLPFAAGVIRGKVNRPMGEDPSAPITPEALSDALAKGNITPAEHAWYTDYLNATKQPQEVDENGIKTPSPNDMKDLQDRATQIIGDNGQQVNTATNEAPFDILTSRDVQNLNASVPDQLIADVPDNVKTALSDYLINNRLDALRENPQNLDGVRGYVDHINQKLEMKASKLAESDKILDDHMTKGMKENMPFSQKELTKNMRKSGFTAKNTSGLPITIPDNIKSHLKQLEKIDSIKAKNKSIFQQYKKSGDASLVEKMKANEQKMEDMKANLEPLLSPREELEDIKKALITDKGLPKNYEHSTVYHRLLDLASVWHNARTLLNRVHMEREYDTQEAYKNLASHVLQVADSDMPRLAKPDDVISYLKARIEGSVLKKEPMAFDDIKAKAKGVSDIPSDPDNLLSEQEEQVKNSGAKDLSQEFTDASEKFKEFKSSEGVFKNLISCVLGGMNG